MYTIVGVESINYVSRKTNRPVVGCKLYVVTDDIKPNLVGKSTTELFVSSQVPNVPVLNPKDKVNIYFNQYGQVQAVIKVD